MYRREQHVIEVHDTITCQNRKYTCIYIYNITLPSSAINCFIVILTISDKHLGCFVVVFHIIIYLCFLHLFTQNIHVDCGYSSITPHIMFAPRMQANWFLLRRRQSVRSVDHKLSAPLVIRIHIVQLGLLAPVHHNVSGLVS